jgi:hypothetical protein
LRIAKEISTPEQGDNSPSDHHFRHQDFSVSHPQGQLSLCKLMLNRSPGWSGYRYNSLCTTSVWPNATTVVNRQPEAHHVILAGGRLISEKDGVLAPRLIQFALKLTF